MVKKYSIGLRGCDDKTTITANLSEEQYKLIVELSKITRKVGGGCKPDLHIWEHGREYWMYGNAPGYLEEQSWYKKGE